MTNERLHNRPKERADLREHARRRAWERYGLIFSSRVLRKFARAICMEYAYMAKCLGSQSRTRTVWLIRYECQNYIVVYDSEFSTIATFLPRHTLGVTPEGKPYFRGYLRTTLNQINKLEETKIPVESVD